MTLRRVKVLDAARATGSENRQSKGKGPSRGVGSARRVTQLLSV